MKLTCSIRVCVDAVGTREQFGIKHVRFLGFMSVKVQQIIVFRKAKVRRPSHYASPYRLYRYRQQTVVQGVDQGIMHLVGVPVNTKTKHYIGAVK